MTMPPSRSVLLVPGPEKAGAALKALPAIRALRASLPEVRWGLLAADPIASLFEWEPGIEVLRLPTDWPRFRGSALKTALSQLFGDRRFSLAVSLMSERKREMDRLLGLLPAEGTRTVSGPVTAVGNDETENVCRVLSEIFGVSLATVARFPAAPVLASADEAEAMEKMGAKHGPWLGFHPFSGRWNRSVALRRWRRLLLRATRDEGFSKIFLFGIPREYRVLESLREACTGGPEIELCFPSSFRAMGAYLRRLDGVVAADAAPLYLARALGVRSLGILAGGDAARWHAELQDGDMVLRRGLFQRLPSAMEMVWAFRKWKPAALGNAS